MAVNHFDQASRFAAKLDSVALLGWLLNLPAGAFTLRGWLDARGVPLPGAADSWDDLVATP